MNQIRDGLVLLVGVALGTAIALSAVPAFNPAPPAPTLQCTEVARTPLATLPGGFVVTLACSESVKGFILPPGSAPPTQKAPAPTPGLRL